MHDGRPFERSVSDADYGGRKDNFLHILIVSESCFSNFFDCQSPLEVRFAKLVRNFGFNAAWDFNLCVGAKVGFDGCGCLENVVLKITAGFKPELLMSNAGTFVYICTEKAVMEEPRFTA